MNMLKMCWNWKVLAGLAVVGLAAYMVAPNAIIGILPVLVLLACPLSMAVMMWSMRGMGGTQAGRRQPPAQPLATATPKTRQEQLVALRAQLEQVDALQAGIARDILRIEESGPDRDQDATPATGAAPTIRTAGQ